MKTLLLVDANALIHRAYHALPPLTTREGAVVHAVYGFISALFSVIATLKPTHVAAAFDLPEPTFRDELFEDYKAHRPGMPDDLVEQIPLAREFLAVMRIPVVEQAGFEADDMIGTIAEQFRGQRGIRVVIATGDLDTLQLVGDNVTVSTLRRGMSDAVTYDRATVEDRYGVSLEQLPDYKGLVGDPSDNIPGIRGIGEKTAAALLGKFASLEEILSAAERDADMEGVAPRVQSALREYADAGRLSKELATIRRDAPVRLDLSEAAWPAFDLAEVEAFLQLLGFRSLVPRLAVLRSSRTPADSPQQAASSAASAPLPYQTFREMLGSTDDVAIIPTLDSAAPAPHLQGMAVEDADGQRRDVIPPPEGWSIALGDVARSAARFVVYDAKPLWRALVAGSFSGLPRVHDALIAAYLVEPKAAGMPLSQLCRMNGVKGLIDLARSQRHQLRERDLEMLFQDVEMPLSPLLARMEVAGIRVDAERLKRAAHVARRRLRTLERQIADVAGSSFAATSPRQLSELLFVKLGVSPKGLKKTSTGKISTAEPELRKIRDRHPVVPLILRHRKLAKIVSTYLDPLSAAVNLETRRIHTTFHQTGTATGRLSSSNPNLQNIPVRGVLGTRVRSAFIPREGWKMLSADYSQLELRIAAVIADDVRMREAFERGEDIHRRTAAEMLDVAPSDVTPDQRRIAKVLNFGVLYGMSSRGVALSAGVSREEGEQFVRRYMEEFSGIARYVRDIGEQARRQGFVATLLGRRRPLPDIRSRNVRVREAARRMAINMPIQGTEADILKVAMLRVDERLRENGLSAAATLLLQIHDELLFEIDPAQQDAIVPLLRDTMENIARDRLFRGRGVMFSLPLSVEIAVGSSWGTL